MWQETTKMDVKVKIGDLLSISHKMSQISPVNYFLYIAKKSLCVKENMCSIL